MAKKQTKIVKVYAEDWEILNKMLGVLQSQKRERQNLADAVHWVLETFMTKVMNDMGNWLSKVYESLPQDLKDKIDKERVKP